MKRDKLGADWQKFGAAIALLRVSPLCLSQHTHYPQYAGPGAAGMSPRGPFGDALLELDDTIGILLATLERTGVLNNTLILFTSDNGLVLAPSLWVLILNVRTALMIIEWDPLLLSSSQAWTHAYVPRRQRRSSEMWQRHYVWGRHERAGHRLLAGAHSTRSGRFGKP